MWGANIWLWGRRGAQDMTIVGSFTYSAEQHMLVTITRYSLNDDLVFNMSGGSVLGSPQSPTMLLAEKLVENSHQESDSHLTSWSAFKKNSFAFISCEPRKQ